jgi:hypothetical protein
MLGLFNNKPLLDEISVQWMYDAFAWALRNFDAQVFFNETMLVTPSNEHFPGQAASAEDMAGLIFEQVKSHAGLQHWPCRLVTLEAMAEAAPPQLALGARRGAGLEKVEDSQRLLVAYDPQQLRAPEVLIASYAHVLAHYLGAQSPEPPPGGVENWPHVTELLAVFLGFGLMMANSANTTKIRSCGSCSGPAVERTNYLSQYDITYALAIFCALKGIPASDVLRHLKKSLRPFYKKAAREVASSRLDLERLRQTAERLIPAPTVPV